MKQFQWNDIFYPFISLKRDIRLLVELTKKGVFYIMATREELDQKLAELNPVIQKVAEDVQSLLDKLNSGGDFSAEIATAQQAVDALKAVDLSVNP